MRKTWVLAGAAVLVAVTVTGGVVAMSSAKQATPAAQEPPANTATGGKGDALGHGLPGWDPDLSGAIGRLAVRRDQPDARVRRPGCPTVGQVVERGQVIYRVDDNPVVLLCGVDPGVPDRIGRDDRART